MLRCPKCRRATLIRKGRYRWQCPYIWSKEEFKDDESLGTSEDIVLDGRMCGFQCGLSFFFDDEDLSSKLEVGLPVSRLKISRRAYELIDTGVLALNDLERAVEIEKLPSISKAQEHEEELEELNILMREVVGNTPEVHRHLSNGESYRKSRVGGLIGKKLA
jgi:hypothetical protein